MQDEKNLQYQQGICCKNLYNGEMNLHKREETYELVKIKEGW